MTFKEFNGWCNNRACDGCWSSDTAIYCIELVRKINALPFWKREKAWNEVRDFVEKEIVQVIEEKMTLLRMGENE